MPGVALLDGVDPPPVDSEERGETADADDPRRLSFDRRPFRPLDGELGGISVAPEGSGLG